MTLLTLWWLSFFAALGLCIGSFLNVIIYRLPHGISLRNPLWSFCPQCGEPIRWFDNIPVVSFLMLRGRCRKCYAPISSRYPVVEMLTALMVLLLLDAFFIGGTRTGLLGNSPIGLTESLAYDWPILLAHIVLFSCLLAMSAIDLEHYWVDIRFTNFATIVGFACHTLWTPRHSMEWIRPWDATAIVCVMALCGLGLVWLMLMCRPDVDPEGHGEATPDELQGAWEGPKPTAPVDGEAPIEYSLVAGAKDLPPEAMAGGATGTVQEEWPTTTQASLMAESSTASRFIVWLAGVLLIGLLVMLLLSESSGAPLRHTGRALIPLLFVFVLIVAESVVARPSDTEIIEAIDEERFDARRMVLDELGMLLPAIMFAVFGFWLMRAGGAVATGLAEALHGEIAVPGISMMRHWSPLEGFATAATGYILAGALGWAVRIVFTLVLGREAFGAGDVHMMAAAGCVAGWPVVVMGFALTCVLALIGWLATLPFKRTRAVPLGPWLSLGFLIVVLFYDRMLAWPMVDRTVLALEWMFVGGAGVGR
jgi:prepilin signal peptidase PulO-like enzyme (type II secretory pathway)